MSLQNKLVRDKVIEILKSEGKEAKFHTADFDEYEAKLFDKLREEVAEFNNAKSLEQLVDILEVLEALEGLYDWTPNDVTMLKEKKRADHGGFTKKLILDEVVENE